MKTTIRLDKPAIVALHELLGKMIAEDGELSSEHMKAEKKAWGWKLEFTEHKIEVWNWRNGRTGYLYEETECPVCKGKGKLLEKPSDTTDARRKYYSCEFCDGDGKAIVCPCTQCHAILGRKDRYSAYECGVCGFKEGE